MSQVVQITFRLFGPRAGHAMSINGHQFVKGLRVLNIASAAIAPLTRVMSFYGAYARGTPEYDEALAKEEANGGNEVQASSGNRPADQVQDDVRPNGAESAAQATVGSQQPVGAASEDTGVDPARYRHTDAGIPKFEERADHAQPAEPASALDVDVRSAVLKLDPDEASHWVQSGPDKGKPKLSAVEEAYGRAGVTRRDVESAAAGYNRSAATEAALGA